MINSKAIKVIKRLNKEEFHKLEKFLSSPYFNTNKNLIKLFKFLKKFHPGFTSARFTRQKVFRYLYQNEDYNDEKLRKLFSDMYKELEKFLVIIQLETDKIAYNKFLLRILDIKKLDKLFHSTFTAANSFLDNSEYDHDYFLEKYLLQWYYISFYLDRGEQGKICRNVFERGNYMALFYLCDLFLTLNDVNANRNTYGFYFEPNLAERFLDNLNVDNFFRSINKTEITYKEIVSIYYFAYRADKNPENENYYHELEKYALKNWDKLSKLGQLTVTAFLMNQCTRNISRGKDEFRYNLNKIYRMFLKYKLFIREDEAYVRSDVFLKILDNFFHIDKIEEAGDELKKNIEHLHPDHRKGILSYYSALVNFSNKKYDETLKELSLIKSNSPLFVNRLKLLQLKTHYELNLFDEAGELANNYRKFVCNHKTISELTRNGCINFLGAYKEILKIRRKDFLSAYSIYALKKQIAGSNPAEKSWLKEKLSEIETASKPIKVR